MCLLLVTEPCRPLPGGSPGLAGEQVSARYILCVCVCACVGGFVISLLPVKKTEEKAQRRGGGWMSDPFIDSSLQRVVILFHRSLLSHSLLI